MKVIHVNKQVIQHNAKYGTNHPPCRVQEGHNATESRYGSRIDILDEGGNVVASVVYDNENPLSCGARLWIETENDVVVRDETRYCEFREQLKEDRKKANG